MAKQSGLGDNLYVGGFDISGDVGSISRVGGNIATLDVTGIDKGAYERIGGTRDGGIEFVAFFNDTPVTGANAVLRGLPSADRLVTYCRGTALGSPSAACVAKQINYDPTRSQDGALSFAVQAQANAFGLEWGVQLTPGKRTDSAPANGTGVDLVAVSTAFGLQAYLQVFGFTGTSAVVKLQDSADNVTFADLAGAAFTTVVGQTSERIAVAGTVRRYLRAVTTGTFTNLVLAVTAVRNDVAVVF